MMRFKRLSSIGLITLALVFFENASVSYGQSTLDQPSRGLRVERDENNRIVQIDFPYGQTIKYSYSDSGQVIEKNYSGILEHHENNLLITKKVPYNDIENFNYLILRDMSERLYALPSLAEVFKNSYKTYFEYRNLSEKEYIRNLFTIYARYFEKKFKQRKITDPQLPKLLSSLSNCESYSSCVDFLVAIKKIELSKFPKSFEKPLAENLEMGKKFVDFMSSYKKCLTEEVFSNLQHLVKSRKLLISDDSDFAGVTWLTNAPTNSYISLPLRLFQMMGESFEVGNRDRKTRNNYFSDPSYDEAGVINHEGEKMILGTIVHEYGHLSQYTRFLVFDKFIENAVLDDVVHNVTSTYDAINEHEGDVLDFNHLEYNDLFDRLMESGAEYFALDSNAACY